MTDGEFIAGALKNHPKITSLEEFLKYRVCAHCAQLEINVHSPLPDHPCIEVPVFNCTSDLIIPEIYKPKYQSCSEGWVDRKRVL